MSGTFVNRIHDLFNNAGARKIFLKLRVPLGIVCLLLLLPQLKKEWFLPGLTVSVIGEMIQVWCLSTIRTRKTLTVTGPYMFVRNPMYIGRFFLVFGILMMTGGFWIMALGTVVYYFYMVNRVRREEPVLREIFGADYLEYCRDVHPYIPVSLGRFDAKKLWSFNRESFTQNHVLVNVAATAGAYLVLWVFTFIRSGS
jgi:protein-S-isoprenylcysteine O-methyltransferase Ste14